MPTLIERDPVSAALNPFEFRNRPVAPPGTGPGIDLDLVRSFKEFADAAARGEGQDSAAAEATGESLMNTLMKLKCTLRRKIRFYQIL